MTQQEMNGAEGVEMPLPRFCYLERSWPKTAIVGPLRSPEFREPGADSMQLQMHTRPVASDPQPDMAFRRQDLSKEGQARMVVKLIRKHHRLTLYKRYLVIGIEGGDYRLLNDDQDSCLYPPWKFAVVNPGRPIDWVVVYDDGVEYAYAPPLNQIGFFEDYHDGDRKTIDCFWVYMRRIDPGCH